jgi:hypothetical protein
MGGLCRQKYQLKIFARLSLVLYLVKEWQHCGILITAKPHYGDSTTETKLTQGQQNNRDSSGNSGGTIVLPP